MVNQTKKKQNLIRNQLKSKAFRFLKIKKLLELNSIHNNHNKSILWTAWTAFCELYCRKTT